MAASPVKLSTLPDEVLDRVFRHLDGTVMFQDARRDSLLTLAHVCRRLRRLVQARGATHIRVLQPRLAPDYQPRLHSLGLASFTAATHLDLSCCLDWVQHPALNSLLDLSAIGGMVQLRSLNLRPTYDDIDDFDCNRIKHESQVLCWANGIMQRLWDRWMMAQSPGIPCLINVHHISQLTNLEELRFPITKRSREVPLQRIQSVAPLAHLRTLALGNARLSNAKIAALSSAQSLTWLSIGDCHGVGERGLEALAKMRRLRTLLLHGCARLARDVRWAALQPLTTLRVLALYGRREGEDVHYADNRVTQHVPMSLAGFQNVCEMTQLEELHTTWAFYRQNRGDDCWAAALSRLQQLQVLGLSGGIASEMLFSTLAGLSCFEKLSLRDVQVAASALQEVGRLSGLVQLAVDNCHATCTAPDHVPSKAITGLPRLQHLLLWESPPHLAPRISWPALSRQTQLTRLTLHHPLPTLELAKLAAMRNLHTLEVDGGAEALELTPYCLEALSGLPNLRNLDLGRCANVEDAWLVPFAQRRQLLTFRLKRSRITDKSIAEIARWPRLRNLSVAHSDGITDASMARLCGAADLKILDLGGCMGISDAGLLPLAGCRQLRQLNLERCLNVSNDGVEAFKQALLAAGPVPQDAPPLHCIVVFF